MYNLSSYFLPVDEGLQTINWQTSQIGNDISKHTTENFPEITNARIALFSVSECEGTENKCNDFSKIRESFYKLHFEDFPIMVDLGNLQLMPTKKESFKQIEKVCATLLENNILPFIIGEGTGWLWRMLERLAKGESTLKEVDLLFDVTKQIEGHTICAFGEASAWPVQGLLRHFRKEIERRNSSDPLVRRTDIKIPYLIDQHLLEKENA